MTTDTWTTIAVPLLLAVSELENELLGRPTRLLDVANRAGLPANAQTYVELERLIADGLVHGKVIGMWQLPTDDRIASVRITGLRLAPNGARELGSWPKPDDLLTSLIATLDEHIEAEEDEARKSGLRKIKDALVGASLNVGSSVVTSMLSAWLRSQGVPI